MAQVLMVQVHVVAKGAQVTSLTAISMFLKEFDSALVGNRSKRRKCGSAPTWKSQWGARLVGRTHVHG